MPQVRQKHRAYLIRARSNAARVAGFSDSGPRRQGRGESVEGYCPLIIPCQRCKLAGDGQIWKVCAVPGMGADLHSHRHRNRYTTKGKDRLTIKLTIDN